jgi:hypothetical protein
MPSVCLATIHVLYIRYLSELPPDGRDTAVSIPYSVRETTLRPPNRLNSQKRDRKKENNDQPAHGTHRNPFRLFLKYSLTVLPLLMVWMWNLLKGSNLTDTTKCPYEEAFSQGHGHPQTANIFSQKNLCKFK